MPGLALLLAPPAYERLTDASEGDQRERRSRHDTLRKFRQPMSSAFKNTPETPCSSKFVKAPRRAALVAMQPFNVELDGNFRRDMRMRVITFDIEIIDAVIVDTRCAAFEY
jgi:hypothetical protein